MIMDITLTFESKYSHKVKLFYIVFIEFLLYLQISNSMINTVVVITVNEL